ncbi:MAG: polymer-forming cytoskeletal protein [Rickettsiales bacterium]|nr:polymer-forming cytoskeletal protein [Rickettsiales bacterium]
MFSKKKSSSINNANIVKLSDFASSRSIPSIIVSDMNIKGDLISNGSIEIGGKVEGNIKCSFVTIRKGADIKGDIYADNLIINGKVNGVMRAKNVSITSFGDIEGSLHYNFLNVESGADIKGRLVKEKLQDDVIDSDDNEFIPEINGMLAYKESSSDVNDDLSLDKTLAKVRNTKERVKKKSKKDK